MAHPVPLFPNNLLHRAGTSLALAATQGDERDLARGHLADEAYQKSEDPVVSSQRSATSTVAS